ncbi:hypothetical protein GCM10023115_01660 [Pontixanthobacter gangjinensis]
MELATSDRGELALSLAAKALAEVPGDPRMAAFGRLVSSHQVPKFHHGMLRDTQRNQLYRKAIERLAPGRKVLDIGTGSGLLAMIAARAGAEKVIACELNPMLAATAREIVAANGLSEKITVIGRHSGMLDRNGDLDGGADLVISEIFSDDLLGESVLPALKHARQELCAPGAIFIPDSAEILVAAVEFSGSSMALGEVEGFDLSLFERHLGPVRTFNPASANIALSSDPRTLFRFDFNAADYPALSRENEIDLGIPTAATNGLAQWIRFTLAEGIVYENRPGSARATHWPVRFTPLGPHTNPIRNDLRIGGWHNAEKLAIWPLID